MFQIANGCRLSILVSRLRCAECRHHRAFCIGSNAISKITESAAGIFRALGDPERFRLVLRLADAEACVSELATRAGGSPGCLGA